MHVSDLYNMLLCISTVFTHTYTHRGLSWSLKLTLLKAPTSDNKEAWRRYIDFMGVVHAILSLCILVLYCICACVYCTVLYCICACVYCTVLYCTLLYCTVLYIRTYALYVVHIKGVSGLCCCVHSVIQLCHLVQRCTVVCPTPVSLY